jgi:hypothetical protein
VETIEGEIIGRIAEFLGIWPSEVVAKKYTPDGAIMWRRYYRIIMHELEEAEKLEELENANPR